MIRDADWGPDQDSDRMCARVCQRGEAPGRGREANREDEPLQWSVVAAERFSDDPEVISEPMLELVLAAGSDRGRPRGRTVGWLTGVPPWNQPGVCGGDTRERVDAVQWGGGVVGLAVGGRHG